MMAPVAMKWAFLAMAWRPPERWRPPGPGDKSIMPKMT